jgi:ribosome-binding protein aMBF1 (putative translation factor)
MTIVIRLNTAEQIRRAREANPGLSQEDLAASLGVTVSQVKAALAYRRPGHQRGRNR